MDSLDKLGSISGHMLLLLMPLIFAQTPITDLPKNYCNLWGTINDFRSFLNDKSKTLCVTTREKNDSEVSIDSKRVKAEVDFD